MNPFQKLMREWAKLAPYNFIHALRFDGRSQPQRWSEIIGETIHSLGFLMPEVSLPATAIDSHLEGELNRAFAADEPPIRFAVIDEAKAYWLTVTLDHWVADDYACRALLERIVSRYHSLPVPLEPLQRRGATIPWSHWWRSPAEFRRQAANLRRAYRIPLRDPLDFRVATAHATLESQALNRIRAFAKSAGATVHDVLLAVAAQALGQLFSDDLVPPRDRIGIASAMNIRRFERSDAQEGFGLVLSQYAVAERRPHEVELPVILRQIAEQTRSEKATSDHAAVFPATLLLWHLTFSRRAKATTFHRGAPLAAGISNVDLTGSWAEGVGARDYRRIGPAGPPVPLVLMITTFEGRVGIDTTYRLTAFTSVAAEGFVADFCQRLASLGAAAPS